MSKLSLTVQLRHPTRLVDEIQSTFGATATGSHEVGHPRTTPKGVPTTGLYAETYLYYDLLANSDSELAAAISRANTFLRSKGRFAADFTKSGGKIGYYVTVSSDEHFAEEFGADLLQECADLGVTIGFEIFLDE